MINVQYQGPATDHTFVRLDKGWLVASYDWFPTFSIEQLLPSPRYLTSSSNSWDGLQKYLNCLDIISAELKKIS